MADNSAPRGDTSVIHQRVRFAERQELMRIADHAVGSNMGGLAAVVQRRADELAELGPRIAARQAAGTPSLLGFTGVAILGQPTVELVDRVGDVVQ